MSYIKKKSHKSSKEIIGALVQELALLGGPICRELETLYLEGSILEIIKYSFTYTTEDPGGLNIDDYLYARQIQALFSKREDLDLGVNKEEAAFNKFCESEQKCRDTNRRFRTGVQGNPGVAEVIYLAQRKITNVLGDVPLISDLHFSFGPGTNTSTKIDETNPRIKLSSRLECSTSFLPFCDEFLREFPHWRTEHWNTVSVAEGKLSFVPKTSLTDRTIIIEPIINGFYQKGIGRYIRERLAKIGLNLRDQQPNQDAAYEGSKSGEIATVDLESASDTIAYGLVLELLPPDWFQFLEIGRSGVVQYNGKRIELQKFSSMGNAYTFELESLIFYSLAHSVCVHLGLSTKVVRSYGDDIIIPTAAFSLLKEVLEFCGFNINLKKSYSSGPFRESCGADYLCGFDIRPFYLKEQLSERVLFLMHNWFIRHCEEKLAAVVKRFVNPDLALYGPDGYGDGHLIGDYVPRTTRKQKRRGYEGGFFDTYTLKKRYNKKLYKGDWIFPVYSIYVLSEIDRSINEMAEFGHFDESVETDPFVVRGSSGYKKVSIYTLATTIFRRDKNKD